MPSSTNDQPEHPSLIPITTRSRTISAMVAWSSTSICWMAWSRSWLAGVPPIDSVKVTAGTWLSFGRRDQNGLPRFGHQIVRPGGAIGVANQPEQLRVLVDTLGDLVEPFAL